MKRTKRFLLAAFLAQVLLAGAFWQSRALADTSPYPARAALDEYMMPVASEIALARSAAPPAIAAGAEVMVLGRDGYSASVKGRNGFLCIVERSWGAATDDSGFWNPKVRAPICFNPSAARTFARIYLIKTRWILSGKSRTQIARALESGLTEKQSRALEPGAMCYMMSKEQYLGDRDKDWRPHLMFFVSGDTANSWGANVPGSPVMAFNDPEERVTVFLVTVGHWSDGSPAAHVMHP